MTLKTRAKWALLGIAGLLLPMLMLSNNTSTGVIPVAVVIASLFGVFAGRKLQTEEDDNTLVGQNGLIAAQRNLLTIKEDLIKLLYDKIDLKTGYIQSLDRNLKALDTLHSNKVREIERLSTGYILMAPAVRGSKTPFYIYVTEFGLFSMTRYPQFAARFNTHRLAHEFLQSKYEFAFFNGAKVVEYPKNAAT